MHYFLSLVVSVGCPQILLMQKVEYVVCDLLLNIHGEQLWQNVTLWVCDTSRNIDLALLQRSCTTRQPRSYSEHPMYLINQ